MILINRDAFPQSHAMLHKRRRKLCACVFVPNKPEYLICIVYEHTCKSETSLKSVPHLMDSFTLNESTSQCNFHDDGNYYGCCCYYFHVFHYVKRVFGRESETQECCRFQQSSASLQWNDSPENLKHLCVDIDL